MQITARLSFASLLLAVLVSATADAASRIYKTVDEDGNVVYTDVAPREPAEAEQAEVILSEPNRIERPPAGVIPDKVAVTPEQPAVQPAQENETIPYTGLALTSPADGQSIRSNGGTITLAAAYEPALAPGHQLRFFLDGRPVGTTPSATMNLENVDRGEHAAQVVIINERGQPMRQSNIVTFYLQRISQSRQVRPPPPTSDGFRPRQTPPSIR